MTGQARAAADTVPAFASDTGRACPAGALYAVAKRCRALPEALVHAAPGPADEYIMADLVFDTRHP
jgi:hypothetical protein